MMFLHDVFVMLCRITNTYVCSLFTIALKSYVHRYLCRLCISDIFLQYSIEVISWLQFKLSKSLSSYLFPFIANIGNQLYMYKYKYEEKEDSKGNLFSGIVGSIVVIFQEPCDFLQKYLPFPYTLKATMLFQHVTYVFQIIAFRTDIILKILRIFRRLL